MKTTISKPPTLLHGSSLTSKGTMENISLKRVDVKFSLFMPHRHMGEVEVWLLHSFPVLALVGSAQSTSCPGRFISRQRTPGAQWI
jgi:hypothetical protein